MLLNKDNCQKIVDRVNNILDKSINIMDTAETMYVHRNTIRYRLNKFIKKYKT